VALAVTVPSGAVAGTIRKAPDLPGVYLFRGDDGGVLYVGKALSLRKRLGGYVAALENRESGRAAGPKVQEMANKARAVEWIVTSSETEALVLEHSLIKQHLPPYNIRLRDDKSYPYIAITIADEYPRVVFTRRPHRRGNRYFGPFTSAAKVRETLDILNRIFPFRTCRGGQPGRRSGGPCLQHDIKRCLAPCGGGVTSEEYRLLVEQVAGFLSGHGEQVMRQLEGQMKAAAAARDFERAALYRDRLSALRHVLEKQQAKTASLGTGDVIGLARDETTANVQLFLTRDGFLADRRSFTLEGAEGATDQQVFERFFGEYYGSALFVPPEIIVPRGIEALDTLSRFLERLRDQKAVVRHAERGDKRRLQQLADKNAALALEQERLTGETAAARRMAALERLRDLLDLERLPLRIEGYDVSNLGSEHVVASMVVFEGGAPRKSDYRRFAIRGFEGQDDTGALREALSRRLGREVAPYAEADSAAPVAETDSAASNTSAAYDPSFEAVPDLILVDGGTPQLGAAVVALAEARLARAIPVLSLAKREEEVFVPGRRASLRLERNDPALLLLQQVRDEAHRFAIGFHRTRRRAAATESFLDSLPGVGEKRKRSILKHFGSPEAFLRASREELESVPGLPGKIARDVYNYVHKTG
jgi:excinuclease ABC subunit C